MGSLGKIFVFTLEENSKTLPWSKILTLQGHANAVTGVVVIENELWACSGNVVFVYDISDGKYDLLGEKEDFTFLLCFIPFFFQGPQRSNGICAILESDGQRYFRRFFACLCGAANKVVCD